jgi:hypothetical protein
MAARPELIFCAGRNRRATEIAIAAGYRYGARLPTTVHAPPYFADQDWKIPNRIGYMAALVIHQPTMATVLDWEREEQWPEVMSWAEEAAEHVGHVVVIPKIPGTVPEIPQSIGGKPVVIGYSVPSRYGATDVPLWEFRGRMVHLLGGSPQAQMRLWEYLAGVADVVSVDVNMHFKMANTRCCYWTRGTTEHGHWQPMRGEVESGATFEAFQLSCRNILEAWDGRRKKQVT